MNKAYKILSLDGGGSWALIQLLTLREKYGNKNGHAILREFDLVIANSGGSIVLAALCANMLINEAIHLFDKKELREKIFKKNKFSKRYFPTDFSRFFGFGPKYSTTSKRAAFNEIFKDIKDVPMRELPAAIGNNNLKLIVCTFDAINNSGKLFKSYDDGEEDFDSVDLIRAIHGSSNAPVNYFDFPAKFKAYGTEKFYYLWDGALAGFNNPVAAGLVEAIKSGVNKKDIKIISLGTSNKSMIKSERNYFYTLYLDVIRNKKTKPLMGIKFFGRTALNLAKSILYEPPDWANYLSYVMRFESDLHNVENKTNFIRLSPMIHINEGFDENTINLLLSIYKLDMDLTDQEDIEIVKQCFEHWKNGKILNQAIKAKYDGEELFHIYGHRSFKEAMADWK